MIKDFLTVNLAGAYTPVLRLLERGAAIYTVTGKDPPIGVMLTPTGLQLKSIRTVLLRMVVIATFYTFFL